MSRVYAPTSPFFQKDARYSDFSVDFDVNPITGNISRITDATAINQSLKAILLSSPGEKVYNRTFGSNLKNSLFELNDPITIESVKSAIRSAIAANEPRITIQDIRVVMQGNDMYVTLLYSIINIPEVYQTNITIARVR